MENNKTNKGLVIALIFFILVSIGLVGYILLNKEKNNNTIIDEKQNIKIDNTKDYVYDKDLSEISDYITSLSEDFIINTEIGANMQENKFALPYININSEDAKKVNDEINDFYTYITEKIKETRECLIAAEGPCCRYNANYVTYKYENYISILIEHSVHSTTLPWPSFLGYVFDINTGKLLTAQEIAETKGKTIDEVKEYFETKIKEFMEEEDEANDLGLFKPQEDIEAGKLTDSFYEETIKRYEKNYKTQGKTGSNYINPKQENVYDDFIDGVIYYINSNGDINAFIPVCEPIQTGIYAHLFK